MAYSLVKPNLSFSTANEIDSVCLSLKSRRSVITVTHPFRIVDTDHRCLLKKAIQWNKCSRNINKKNPKNLYAVVSWIEINARGKIRDYLEHHCWRRFRSEKSEKALFCDGVPNSPSKTNDLVQRDTEGGWNLLGFIGPTQAGLFWVSSYTHKISSYTHFCPSQPWRVLEEKTLFLLPLAKANKIVVTIFYKLFFYNLVKLYIDLVK